MVLFINPVNRAPGVYTGPAPGASWEKNLLRNNKAQSFHILHVAMYSGPLYKSCQQCPGVYTGPAPGASWEKHKKKNLLLRNHKAQSFHILYVAMSSGPLLQILSNMALESKMAPPLGSLAPIDLPWEKHKKKSSSSKPQGTELFYFVCSYV